MVLLNNDSVASATYEAPAFLETCNHLFASDREFIVVCKYEAATKCRNGADLFLKFAFQPPRGLKRLKILAKMGFVGMRVAPLLAVCNKAILLHWEITLRSDENRILHLKPA